ITLEVTARKGHSLANGHVARWALSLGIPLTINTDAHSPSDLITTAFARQVLLAAGVEANRIDAVFENARELVEKAIRR
ncbi:MAG TPA: PHP domain-containing protein, partial [Dissulfurispiraceae bacterium]|nr:PHP domain-containing protein [Dissulfurispiraceae bacterium]